MCTIHSGFVMVTAGMVTKLCLCHAHSFISSKNSKKNSSRGMHVANVYILEIMPRLLNLCYSFTTAQGGGISQCVVYIILQCTVSTLHGFLCPGNHINNDVLAISLPFRCHHAECITSTSSRLFSSPR